MNVDFPFHPGLGAFWTIVGTMVAIFVGMLGYFRWRRWL
jgi:Mg2+ and Co2+ transporter CorA